MSVRIANLNDPARFAAVMLPAVAITGGLFWVMNQLITEKFQPEDTIELSEMSINPRVDDIELAERTLTIDTLKAVETPPAPPPIERAKADKPTEIIADTMHELPDFAPPKITPTTFTLTIADKEEQPLVRVAPKMPPRADRSGHCVMRFNINPDGAPFDVSASSCSQNLFARASVKAVQKWKYAPKVQDGRPVSRSGVETIIRFQLVDANGQLIPE